MSAQPSPPPSPRGLVPRSSRRSRARPGSSTTSLASEGSVSRDHSHSLRASVSSVVDKLKKRSDHADRREGDNGKGALGAISSILSNPVKKRRRRKKETMNGSDEAERGITGADLSALTDRTGVDADQTSQSLYDDDDDRSSMMTDDSDSASLVTAPPLQKHPSHAGYLTYSSPLLQNSVALDNTSSPTPNRPTDPNEPSSNAHETHSSLPSSSLPILDHIPKLVPRAATAPKSRENSPTRSSEKESSIKSTNSPVGRLKEAFKVGPSRRTTSPNPSPERESEQPEKSTSGGGGSGAGLGGLFGRGKGDDSGRRSSISSRRASRAGEIPDQQPPPPLPAPIIVDTVPDRPSTAQAKKSVLKIPSTPPDTALAPVTTVTPPTPTLDVSTDQFPSPQKLSSRAQTTSVLPEDKTSTTNIVTSPSGNMISHRRVRSSSASHAPSKLSNIVSAPLTPTIEESQTATTPGQGQGQGPPGPGVGGFFSNVFSAAQNAATSLSNSIANTTLAPGQNRARSGTQGFGDKELADGSLPSESVDTGSERGVEEVDNKPRKKLAVETIGQGELSLSHLGILADTGTSSNGTPMGSRGSPASSVKGAPTDGTNEYTMLRGGDGAFDSSKAQGGMGDILRLGSAENGSIPSPQPLGIGKSGGETGTPVAEDSVGDIQFRAHPEQTHSGDHTPPHSNEWDDRESSPIHRKDSVRSGTRASRRKRGSSAATTATTIGAAIGASHATFAHPSAMGSVPRLTGFAVASKKRNRDFHLLFRSVPEDDYLIEDYGCALQRDILLQGRLYVSEGHICFYSNIFGWITTLVISFDEVMSVEKKSTAMVFPNAIVIQTLHARNIFASFMSRDSTYDLLVGIWKISHPSLQSSQNGVRLNEAGGGDKTVKQEESASEDGSDEEYDDEDEVYDEDEDGEEGLGSFTEAVEGSVDGSEEPDAAGQALTQKSSSGAMANGATANGAHVAEDGKTDKAVAGGPTAAQDFPGPPTHAPTSVTDPDCFCDKIVKDEIIAAPLGKIYSLLFGLASGDWVTKFLLEDQKVLDLQFDDKKALTPEKKSRSYSYIKPLNASIGPKQTKCNITETLDIFDLEKAVVVTVVTQTPDVPSGNVFSVKTKYVLSWAENNGTRLVMSCAIEWTGKSWLKGPIEKGASDGQVGYAQSLFAALRSAVTSKARTAVAGSKTPGKSKGRKRKAGETATKSSSRTRGADSIGDSRAVARQEDWGLFEPLRGLLGPLVDILKPVLSGNIALGIVVVLVVVMWIRQSRLSTSVTTGGLGGYGGLRTADRLAAYEEIWRREESHLWDWIEERVGLEHMHTAYTGMGDTPANQDHDKGKVREREMEEGLKDERMEERDIEEAIRITQERLDGLKRVIQKRKQQRLGGEPPLSPSSSSSSSATED